MICACRTNWNERHAAWERFGKPENERHAAWERSSPRLVPQHGSPENASNCLFQVVFEPFWSSTGAPTLCTPKNGPPQVDAKELPKRWHQTLIFKTFFVNFVLRDRLDGPSKRALHFQNMQYRIGFIHVLDAFIESMLDRRKVTPKSQNERHAAWERSGEKRNERHTAWEPFSCF